MTARDHAIDLLHERAAYPEGSPDWMYRSRAAWVLDQMHRGIPADEYTPEPPGGWNRPGSIAATIGQRIAA